MARRLARALALVVGLGGLLAGCAMAPQADQPEAARRAPAEDALPPMRVFGGAPPPLPLPPNAVLAQDFMDLTFRMESGARLPVLTRYEEPIRVGVAGPAAPTLGRDLDALLRRLRREAGLDIARAVGSRANVVIETVPRHVMRRLVPQAACFVVPNVASWADYRRLRRSEAADWTLLARRTRTTIFVPDAIPPQELRDCLHEELAQAVGPLGDLWRLPGSVFNDDNFQAVLTSADMLVLRATYAPELASGMSEAEVAARLPGVLARLNPSGGPARPVGAATAPRPYAEAIEVALTEAKPEAARRAAAAHAAALARPAGGAAEGFALYALGRLTLASDPEVAQAAFERAAAIYDADPRTEIHAAHVGLQLAALALRRGDAREALALARRHARAAGRGQNAALLASLGLIEAEALALMGRGRGARAARLDSLGWARYGFGPVEEVRARMREIAALAPRPPTRSPPRAPMEPAS